MFNAIKYSKELEDAGFTRIQAEATINAFYKFMDNNFATKTDLERGLLLTKTDLREEMNQLNFDLRGEISKVSVELKAEIQVVKAELKEEIQAVSIELKEEIQVLRTEFVLFKKEFYAKFENLEDRMTIKFGVMQAASIAILAAIIKLT